MTNNDILRQLRYTFDLKDPEMVKIFSQAEVQVKQQDVVDWLRKDDQESFKKMDDEPLAAFLNGLINEKRGKKEGPQPALEKSLNNNMILRKLRIALDLKEDAMLEVFSLADMRISKHELSAFFRKPSQSQYRECKDQFLRNFLHGLQIKYRKTEKQ